MIDTDQNIRPFAAHLRKASGDSCYTIMDENFQEEKVEVQLIKDHLNNTSKLASKFASIFGAEEYALQIGLAHDIGKYSAKFQKRIWENGPKIDHSTAGAKEEININNWNIVGVVAASCIAGHHAGLLNVGSNILRNCIEKGKSSMDGAYTLTVPTGGGKTVASLAFALNNAVTKNKNRIIYVVPYCSIIDQTVDVFSDILGKKNVLAHYSNIDISDNDEDDDLRYSKKLATENWDKPVIVTTAVQFFESLFACRTSQCRKLHNIANAVVIFDEAQTIPQQYMKPCISSILELINNYKCTCVFCTATQPALNRFLRNTYINHVYADMKTTEICEDTDYLYREFKRVTYKNKGKISDAEIADELMKQSQVLCIVSTRKHAYNLYHLLKGEGNYHLSKCMTSIDIKSTLITIRKRLKDGKVCRVIATNLVEAGVDLDFKIVYRAKTGLDSIIQAGGRCNREGKYPTEESMVYIFQPEDKYLIHLPEMIKRSAAITFVHNNVYYHHSTSLPMRERGLKNFGIRICMYAILNSLNKSKNTTCKNLQKMFKNNFWIKFRTIRLWKPYCELWVPIVL